MVQELGRNRNCYIAEEIENVDLVKLLRNNA